MYGEAVLQLFFFSLNFSLLYQIKKKKEGRKKEGMAARSTGFVMKVPNSSDDASGKQTCYFLFDLRELGCMFFGNH